MTKQASDMQTHTTLRKFGASVGIAIPAKLREKLSLTAGLDVRVTVVDTGFLVEPLAMVKRYTLAELLAQCDPTASLSEDMVAWRNMDPVGRERLDG